MKKILSIILVMIICLSCTAVVYAEEDHSPCLHKNATYKLVDEGETKSHTMTCLDCQTTETQNCTDVLPEGSVDDHCDLCERALKHEDTEWVHDENSHKMICSMNKDAVYFEGEHTWGEWAETKPASEEAKGEETRKCDVCGRTETRETDKLEHEHKYTDKVVTPTCTEKGYTKHSCACGYSYSDSEVDAKGHSYTSKTVAPTCEEAGYTKHECKCGYSYKDAEVAKKGHTFSEWKVTKEATYKEEGEKTRTCSVATCKKVEIEKIDKIAHECNYESVVTKPTCEKEGFTTKTCKLCGDTQQVEIVSATGHDEKNAKIIDKVEATCTKEGYTGDKICPLCKEILKKGEKVKKLAHDWNEKGFCKICKVDKTNPKTGDNIMISVSVMLASMAGLTACAFVYKKKFAYRSKRVEK